MSYLRGLFLGLIIGSAATWFLTSTQIGRDLVARGWQAATGWARQAPGEAGEALTDAIEDLSRFDFSGSVEEISRRAEQFAQDVSDDATLRALAGELESLARDAGANVGAAAVEQLEQTYVAALELPELEALGDGLEEWQRELAAYEMTMRADDVDEDDAAESEQMLASTFAPAMPAALSAADSRRGAGPGSAPVAPPAAQPAEPAPDEPPSEPADEADADEEAAAPAPDNAPPTAIRTDTADARVHPRFYKCPVIEVSNSGPVADDLELTNYTPWVESPAGALIRAPVETACLSSGYGTRQVDGASRNHAGVDYYNRDGAEIYAAGDGVVTLAGEDGAYGTAVRIDHGGGVTGLYAHMVPGSLQVSSGDLVSLGQPIGIMGSSGRAYAVHLHYELRFGENTVDPLYEGPREDL
ncbi:MAG: M23 family metallopeptidase [Maricaulaceae bacterium]|jgi:murein DD-endopeptidase MepM/ murein hydrolase activator NlpD